MCVLFRSLTEGRCVEGLKEEECREEVHGVEDLEEGTGSRPPGERGPVVRDPKASSGLIEKALNYTMS